MNASKILGATIKKLRKSKGWSQQDFLHKLKWDITTPTYAGKEQTGTFTEKELTQVASALGKSVTQLEALASEVISVEDGMRFLIASSIKQEATQYVMLRAVAELLYEKRAKRDNHRTTLPAILDELTMEIEVEVAHRTDEMK